MNIQIARYPVLTLVLILWSAGFVFGVLGHGLNPPKATPKHKALVPYAIPAQAVHTHVHSPGKPTLAVNIAETAVYALKAQQATSLTIPLETDLNQGELNIQIQAVDVEIELTGQTTWLFNLGAPGPLKLPIDIVPLAPGIYYLNVVVQHQIDSQAPQTRVLAVELRVDQPRLYKTFEKSLNMTDPNAVIALPGQETIY